MLSLTRQERFLVYSLIVILGVGGGLVALKRSFGINFFGVQERPQRFELKNHERSLMVFVKGAVEDVGVYQIPLGSRVIEAVQKAKPLVNADLVSLPLADFVRDGQTIVVPESSVSQNISLEMNSEVQKTSSTTVPKVNINTAEIIELDGLPGVGPGLASRIIAFRKEQPFTSVEDLLKVSGIGRKKFDDIKDKVRIE
jgi:competence protein ComEA